MGLIMRTIQTAKSGLYNPKEGSAYGGVKQEEKAKDEDGNEERDFGTNALDTLCLALGLLTNLVQVVDEAKDVVRRTRKDPLFPTLQTY